MSQPVSTKAAILNRDCHCETLDLELLHHELASGDDGLDLYRAIREQRPHLFSATPVFIEPEQARQMQAIIGAVERVVALPQYQTAALRWAPAIAAYDPGPRGVFIGYDFHLGEAGPQLIEINTNAGGALLNTVLARAQILCCTEVGPVVGSGSLELAFYRMFVAEWQRQRGDLPLQRIAIVDSNPENQYLHPEFALFARLFQAHGVATAILDPSALQRRDGGLWHAGARIDMVYNRLTDFALEDPAHSTLCTAYLENEVVLTPHPRAHALYADKRNLSLLSDATLLSEWRVAQSDIELLTHGVPRTVLLNRVDAAQWWAQRKQWFFKPASGYGSRAVYRGDKLTRRVFEEILQGDYIAQAVVAPGARRARGGVTPQEYKTDWRNYVYAGEVQLLAARLYQGQATNFRTEGGGFAPVFYPAGQAARRCPLPEVCR